VIHPPPERPSAPEPLVPGLPRHPRGWAVEGLQSILLAALLFAVINNFVAQPVQVELSSMEPTLAPGDRLLVDKLTPRWDPYRRGDVVVFDAPPPYDADGVPYVKRVIGLPGETVLLENGAIFIAAPGGAPVRLDEPYLDGAGPTLPRGTPAKRPGACPMTRCSCSETTAAAASTAEPSGPSRSIGSSGAHGFATCRSTGSASWTRDARPEHGLGSQSRPVRDTLP